MCPQDRDGQMAAVRRWLVANRDLYFARLDTKLQGTKLLGVQGINVEGGIEKFIEWRLVKQRFPWKER